MIKSKNTTIQERFFWIRYFVLTQFFLTTIF